MREFFKACNVYCRPATDQAIVAAVYNHGGMTAEKPNEAVIVTLSDALSVKRAIESALDRCEYEESFNYSNRKRTDWPAFQLSGCKTIRQFESQFIHLYIRGVNEKNFFYEIASPGFGQFGLHLRLVVNANSDEYGQAVQYIVAKYVVCSTVEES